MWKSGKSKGRKSESHRMTMREAMLDSNDDDDHNNNNEDGEGNWVRPPFVVDGIDITQPHEDWIGNCTVPPASKRSIWWTSYHEVVVDGTPGAVCNLCGQAKKLAGSTSSLSRHVHSKHPTVYEALCLAEGMLPKPPSKSNSNKMSADPTHHYNHHSNTMNKKRPPEEMAVPLGAAGLAGAWQAEAPQTRNKKRGTAAASAVPVAASSLHQQQQLVHYSTAGAVPANKRERKAHKSEISEAAVGNLKNAMAFYAAALHVPFASIDHPVFHNVLQTAVQAAKVGARYLLTGKTIRDHILLLAEQARNRIQERMKGASPSSVVASVHHWKSRSQYVYVTLAVHWIDDDFKLNASTLAVYVYKEGEVTSCSVQDLVQKLEEWGLTKESTVPFVVTDSEAKGPFFSKMGIHHVFCLDYLLQQVAAEAFHSIFGTKDDAPESLDVRASETDKNPKNDSYFDESDSDHEQAVEEPSYPLASGQQEVLKTARLLALYFHKCPQAAEKLSAIQQELKPQQATVGMVIDVIDRWWSTLAMIDRMVDLREAICIYDIRHGFPDGTHDVKTGTVVTHVRMLTTDEWDMLMILRTLLKPLSFAQNLLEGNSYVTSSLVPFIVYSAYSELVLLCSDHENGMIREAAGKMQAKMQEIFKLVAFGGSAQPMFAGDDEQNGAPLIMDRALMFAHALDPRFKSLANLASNDIKEELWNTLEEELFALGPLEDDDDVESTAARHKRKDAMLDPLSDTGGAPEIVKYAALYHTQADDENDSENDVTDGEWRIICNTEIVNFRSLRSQRIQMGHYDPLVWWQQHHLRLPNLWRLARIYLAIPAIAATRARAFKVAGNLETLLRCQQSGDAMDSCHFLHENASVYTVVPSLD